MPENNTPFVFVAGSAHLDILSRVTGDDLPVDKIGKVTIEIGGTAGNMAINMAKLGVKTVFLTAMNRSPYSAIVSEHLSSSGVKMEVVYEDSLPTAAFVAQIDHDGELMTAISSMPVDQYAFSEEQVIDAMLGAICVVLDCNLSSSNLETIIGVANDMFIPVFVAAVSEEKSIRLKTLQGTIDGIFLNSREAAYLRRFATPSATSYQEMSINLNTTLIVTKGKDGVEIIPMGHNSIIVPPPSVPSENSHFLGAGDAFMSASVYFHMFNDEPIEIAALSALSFVEELMQHGNCNLGNERAIEAILLNLHSKASNDKMTGLLNRASIESNLENLISRTEVTPQSIMSVVMLDIDHFKSINDTFGHATGDVVIEAVADRIKQCVRQEDVAGRWGGEEFLCVLPGANIDVAMRIAERIRIQVESTIQSPRQVTVSIGVAQYQKDVDNMRSFIERADNALYEAKQTGRNNVKIAETII